MADEILNIDYHIKRLIVKALNKYKSVGQAAIALGITERTLFSYLDQYRIIRVEKYVVDGQEDYLKRIVKHKNQYNASKRQEN